MNIYLTHMSINVKSQRRKKYYSIFKGTEKKRVLTKWCTKAVQCLAKAVQWSTKTPRTALWKIPEQPAATRVTRAAQEHLTFTRKSSECSLWWREPIRSFRTMISYSNCKLCRLELDMVEFCSCAKFHIFCLCMVKLQYISLVLLITIQLFRGEMLIFSDI